MEKFKFSIMTEEGKVFDGCVEKVIIKTYEGETTIIKNYQPLITTTVEGKLIISQDENNIEYEAGEGLLRIGEDEVVLICKNCTKK